VFASRRKVILVHGCFWHRHCGCKDAGIPKSRRRFWSEKLTRNADRDVAQVQRLRELGWDVHIIWECETHDMDRLSADLRQFLQADVPQVL
jgi:DNA mismatch endonuclease (patch repair protein)